MGLIHSLLGAVQGACAAPLPKDLPGRPFAKIPVGEGQAPKGALFLKSKTKLTQGFLGTIQIDSRGCINY